MAQNINFNQLSSTELLSSRDALTPEYIFNSVAYTNMAATLKRLATTSK